MKWNDYDYLMPHKLIWVTILLSEAIFFAEEMLALFQK